MYNVAFITKATPDTADSHGCSWLVSSSYPQAVSAKTSVHHTWKFQCLLTFLEAMTPKVLFLCGPLLYLNQLEEGKLADCGRPYSGRKAKKLLYIWDICQKRSS